MFFRNPGLTGGGGLSPIERVGKLPPVPHWEHLDVLVVSKVEWMSVNETRGLSWTNLFECCANAKSHTFVR